MTDIKITGCDYLFSFFNFLCHKLLILLVEIQLIAEHFCSIRSIPTIWEINIQKQKIWPFNGSYPPIIVKTCRIFKSIMLYWNWKRLFIKDSSSRISRPLWTMPNILILLHRKPHLSWQLMFKGFHLLQTENIRIFLLYKIKKTLLQHSSNPINISRNNFHPTTQNKLIPILLDSCQNFRSILSNQNRVLPLSS